MGYRGIICVNARNMHGKMESQLEIVVKIKL